MYRHIRILGIDPCSRGYGFAVIDVPNFLVDWGVAKLKQKNRSGHRRKLSDMIERFAPDVIVLPRAEGGNKRESLTIVIAEIRHARPVPSAVRVVSIDAVRKAFPAELRTKYQRAEYLVALLPDLKPLLPRPRKIWESEDARMNIFDALCLIYALPERVLGVPRAA